MAKKEAEIDITNVAKRLAILRPYLDGEAPLPKVATAAGSPRRTEKQDCPSLPSS